MSILEFIKLVHSINLNNNGFSVQLWLGLGAADVFTAQMVCLIKKCANLRVVICIMLDYKTWYSYVASCQLCYVRIAMLAAILHQQLCCLYVSFIATYILLSFRACLPSLGLLGSVVHPICRENCCGTTTYKLLLYCYKLQQMWYDYHLTCCTYSDRTVML